MADSDIQVSLTELSNNIQKLQLLRDSDSLSSALSLVKESALKTSTGALAETVTQINTLIDSTTEQIACIINNSVVFLENTEAQFKEADLAMAGDVGTLGTKE
ncbi:MAG: hypothetical protein LBS58_00105 [Coriobacteriales bacterium]|jgi:hypothetical protein|nr:hypothetical protein [Coriobacteriales bacterium]